MKKSKNPPLPIELPEGTRREQTVSRGIRWPEGLYQDLWKLCSDAQVSITSVVVALTRNWVKQEKSKLKK